MRKEGQGKVGQCSDNTKLSPRNRECQDTESTRQARSTWQQHSNQPGISPFSTGKGLITFIEKGNRKVRSGTTGGNGRGWGSRAQGECDPPAVAVTWSYGDVLAGSKEFHGRSWKRALCCICIPTSVGKNFPGIWQCVASKSAEIFTGNLDKGRGGPQVSIL